MYPRSDVTIHQVSPATIALDGMSGYQVPLSLPAGCKYDAVIEVSQPEVPAGLPLGGSWAVPFQDRGIVCVFYDGPEPSKPDGSLGVYLPVLPLSTEMPEAFGKPFAGQTHVQVNRLRFIDEWCPQDILPEDVYQHGNSI